MKQILKKVYLRIKIIKHWLLIGAFGATSYCKHQPSCSHYTWQKIKQEGLLVGGFKGLKRILACI